MIDSFPLCTAAGLKVDELEVKSRSFPYASKTQWVLDAADVESYLARNNKTRMFVDGVEIPFVVASGGYLSTDTNEALFANAGIIRRMTMPNFFGPKLDRQAQLANPKPKGDDRMPNVNNEFFSEEDFQVGGEHGYTAKGVAEIANKIHDEKCIKKKTRDEVTKIMIEIADLAKDSQRYVDADGFRAIVFNIRDLADQILYSRYPIVKA